MKKPCVRESISQRVYAYLHADLATVIHQFGYLAILVGALLEGETVLVLGGFAAHQGHLALPSVMALAAWVGLLAINCISMSADVSAQS